MSCTVCGFTNPAGVLACQACGTPLVVLDAPRARPGDAVCATHADRPALAPCERCGTFYCAVCLLRGPDGRLLCEPCRTRAVALPWDQRAELGVLRAWWKTSVLLLQSPTQTLMAAPRDASLGSSIFYALISTVAGFLTTFAAYAVMLGLAFVAGASQAGKLEGDAGMAAGASVAIGAGVMIVYGITIFAGQLIALVVLAGIEHLVLHLLGERNIGGYTVTVRAHALGLSPYLLGLVPFCGVLVMGMWSLVLRCLVLTHLQRVSTGKAVVAVLSPMAVMCFCIFGFYALMLASVLSTIGNAG
jgi:hypothetical protein